MFTASAGSIRNIHENLKSMYHLRGAGEQIPWGIVNSVVGTLHLQSRLDFPDQGLQLGICLRLRFLRARPWLSPTTKIALGRQKRIIVIGAEDGDLDSILPFAGMQRASRLLQIPPPQACPLTSGGAALSAVAERPRSFWSRWNPPGSAVPPSWAKSSAWGQASDGYNPAIPHPEGDGICRAMENALRQRGSDPGGHRLRERPPPPGTTVGDIAEAKASGASSLAIGTFRFPQRKPSPGTPSPWPGALEASLCLISHAAGFTPGHS